MSSYRFICIKIGYEREKGQDEEIIQRIEVKPTVKRKRGISEKEVSRRLLPILNKPSHSVNFDITHKSFERYKELAGKIFLDPNTNRLYIVTVVCYTKTLRKPIAYRKYLDDIAPDSFDHHLFEIEGTRELKD